MTIKTRIAVMVVATAMEVAMAMAAATAMAVGKRNDVIDNRPAHIVAQSGARQQELLLPGALSIRNIAALRPVCLSTQSLAAQRGQTPQDIGRADRSCQLTPARSRRSWRSIGWSDSATRSNSSSL